MTNLENLVRVGSLTVEKRSLEEIDGLLRSGERQLADSMNTALARESRFNLAYTAAHAFALAALRWHGYRSRNRYVVFQALPDTLGIENATVRILDKCHGMRNDAEYEGTLNLDTQLLNELIAAATLVRDALRELRRKRT